MEKNKFNTGFTFFSLIDRSNVYVHDMAEIKVNCASVIEWIIFFYVICRKMIRDDDKCDFSKVFMQKQTLHRSFLKQSKNGMRIVSGVQICDK